MDPFPLLRSRATVLDFDDIDTDQIIPARFLKTTVREGLGEHLFHDWRYEPDGRAVPGFPLNREGSGRPCILIAGDNFGCGSSREHAVWALTEFGFRAVVARSFGDIFRQNALRNRLLPVELPAGEHLAAIQCLETDPDAEVTIDLGRQVVVLPDGKKFRFPVDPFALDCLLTGVDEIGYVLEHEASIVLHELTAPAW